MSIGGENVYTCEECGGFTSTIDVDEGVTPFMILCRARPDCHGWAQSAMYPKGPRPPRIPAPAWEWYKPGADEMLTLSPANLGHVKQGGLLLRAIKAGGR